MNPILYIIGITLLPLVELRASIPYGILALRMSWFTVFIIAVIANAILGPVIFLVLDKVINFLLRFKIFKRIYDKTVEKAQTKVKRAVDKYGEWILAIFIGIPLPGSGSYTGALLAYILGLKFRKFVVANTIGVIIAGAIVTAVVMSGVGIFNAFIG